jgi:hypothetical protein
MKNHPSTTPRSATMIKSRSIEVRVFKQAEDREHDAPREAIGQIAAWVNEGGAGGEVKR